MAEKQSKDSQFVSIPGLFCLLFFAVLANYFHAWLISAFLLLFFLLCLSSYVWSRGVCKRVEVAVAARQQTCYAGDFGVIELRVKNRSIFPLVWLDVIVPTGPKPLMRQKEADEVSWFAFFGENKSTTGLRERFVWMLWQQEIIWQEEYLAEKRGVVEIKGIHLQAGDGFGLSAREEWVSLPVPIRLLIYPKRIPVQVGRFLRIIQEAAARNYGQTEDITILKSSRPYQAGDPMKKINWRLLAASGQMITNVYETVMPGCVAFLLELESFRRIVEKEGANGGTIKETFVRTGSLERMLSLIASCMAELAERRIQTALFIPAYGSHEAVLCIPQEGRNTLAESLEALAMVDYRAENTVFPYEEFWQASYKLGNLYICARTDERNSFEGLTERMGRSRTSLLALKKTDAGCVETGCLYGEEIGVIWTEQEESYERIS